MFKRGEERKCFICHHSDLHIDISFQLPHCSLDEYLAHGRESLVPVSRFRAEDIQTLLDQMHTFSLSLPLSSLPLSSLRYLCTLNILIPADSVLLVQTWSMFQAEPCPRWITRSHVSQPQWIISVINAIPSNYMHAEYRLEGDVLKRLHDVTNCFMEEFLTTISDHVQKRAKLLEQAIMQSTCQ